MLKPKNITFFVKRFKMVNVYTSGAEIRQMVKDLTPSEIILFTFVKDMVLQSNASVEMLKNDALAKKLDVSPSTISKMKSILKSKGYMIINFSKDSDGDPTAQVYLGKDQVTLYNLGLKVEITDARAYKKLIKMFPIEDASLTKEQRQEAVKQANQFIQNNPDTFK